MGNFAVSCSDELNARGKNLIAKLMQPGGKQSDALERMFKIVEEQADDEIMRQGGIDVQALDASLENIKTMFLAAVTGKEQIIAEKDSKIADVKNLKDRMEKDLREKLDAADEEKKASAEQAEAAAKAAAQAIKDSQAAKEQAETANRLASEKDRTIATLADKLSAAEAKIEGYDALMQKEAEAREKIKELYRDLETVRADHSAALRELQAEMERKISDAEKDAALAVATAVAEKERELSAQLRAADKENARLQARVEILEEQIRAARDRNGQ